MLLHMRLTRSFIILLWMLSLCFVRGESLKAQDTPPPDSARRQRLQGLDPSKWTVGPDGKRYAPTGKPAKKTATLPDLKPAEPFVTINGESLTWGALHAHLDLLISNIRLPTGVTAKDLEAERDSLIMGRLSSIVRNHCYKTLLAQEARRCGLTLTEQEVTAKVNDVMAKIKEQKRNPERYLSVFEQPGSFFHADLTNSLLLAKLEKEIILPGIVITDADIDAAMRERETTNRDLIATNRLLRPQLQKLRQEIIDGKDTFSNVAYIESDCGSSMEYGEVGTAKCEDILPALVNVLTNLNLGEISEVVETPHSFHVLKLNKINRGFLKEGGKGPAPIVSINFAQIMLEKTELLPEISRDDLKTELIGERKKIQRDALLDKLIATAKIESVQELNLKPRTRKSAVRRKVRSPDKKSAP